MNDDNWKINNKLQLNERTEETNKNRGLFSFFTASKSS